MKIILGIRVRINTNIIITTILLIVSIVFFGLSDIDTTVQDMFFDHNTHTWILGRDTEPYHFIFYSGIKKLLIIIAICLLLSLLFYKTKIIKKYRKGILIVVLSAILVPSTIAILKQTTNMPCPKHELHYKGIYPKSYVWQRYPKEFVSPKTRCWPAGHASGGFALFSLFFLFKSRKNKIISIIFAMDMGWNMGLYKMIVGDHFLSHTVISMILSWLIVLLIAKILRYKKSD